MRLTLLRGIVIGILGMLIGLWVYNFFQFFFSWEPVPFSFEGPLGSLYAMLGGVAIVLQGEVTHLSLPFLALPLKRDSLRNLDNFPKHFFMLMGSFFMVLGFVLLIWKPLNIPDPKISDAQQTSVPIVLGIIFIGILLSIGGISWYLSLRDKHHAVQREQEGQRLSEDPMM